MKLYELTKRIEQIASEYPNVNYIEESGDIYNLNAHNDVKYTAFCALPQGLNITDNLDGTQTANYSYTLFYVDRLMNDNLNKLAIFSNGDEFFKYLLERLYDELDITYTNYSSTNFTERFNDECAGVYVTLDLNIPMDTDCYSTFDEVEDINKEIREKLNQINGTTQGVSIMDKLDVTDSLREQLATNINYKGVPTTEDEGLVSLVPKVREIESVNLTPTNILLDVDLGNYVQKYYDADYPVVVAYQVMIYRRADEEPFTSPWNCDRVVVNGEVYSLNEGDTIDITVPTNIMFSWHRGMIIETLKSPYPIYGNNGQLPKIYTLGTYIRGMERSLTLGDGGNTYRLKQAYIGNEPIELVDQVTETTPWGNATTPLEYFVVTGIKKWTYAARNWVLGCATNYKFMDLEEVVNTSTNGQFMYGGNDKFVPRFDYIYPKIKKITGRIGWPYTPQNEVTYDFYSTTLEEWINTTNLSNFGAINPNSATFNFETMNRQRIILPNCKVFVHNIMATTSSTAIYGKVTHIELGTVTEFGIDPNTNRLYFLGNVIVGEDTDIDLNLIGFGAGYATDRRWYTTDQEVEDECLKVITKIRNGLLNKVKDHSNDGETRTITLTNLISNFTTNATPAVVSAVNQLIEDFNAKGWTVI